MKALVTGSAGFVGRHMTAELHARGWIVVECDIADPQRQRRFDAMDVFTDQAFPGERFDLVVHAAAVSPHRAAIDGQPEIFPRNVALDAAMFAWAIRTRPGRVLYLSSSAAYPVALQGGNAELSRLLGREGLQEDAIHLDGNCRCSAWECTPIEPDATYGWAKLTGEKMAEAVRAAGVEVTVVRPFSGYGEDQSLDFPFPSIVDRAARGDLTVWGPPGQTRDWIHIVDVVAGALAVVESGTTEPVNLCTGVGTEMGELARMVAAAAGVDPAPEVTYQPDKPTGVLYRVGSPDRLHRYYRPPVTLEQGIERALAARAARV